MLEAAIRSSPAEEVFISQVSRARFSAIVAVTMLVLILAAADRHIFAVVLPHIKTDLGLSDSALGLLSSLPFALCFGLFSIPTAWLGDARFGRTRVVAASLAIWSLMTALCGAAVGLWSLFALRMGVGAGEAGGQPSSLSIVTELAPASWRRRIMAICTLGIAAGGAFGIAFSGWAAQNFGWRMTFAIMGAPGIAVAMLYLFIVQEPRKTGSAHPPAGNFLSEIKALFASRSFVMLFIGSGFVTWLSGSVHAWLPTYLVRGYGVSLTEIGGVLATITLISGLAGLLTFSWIADRLALRDSRWPFWICAILSTGAVALFVGVLFASDKLTVYILTTAMLFLSSGNAPLMGVAAQDALPRLKATGLAAMAVGASLIGALAPWAIGAISDLFKGLGDYQSLRMGLLTIGPIAILATFAFLDAARSLDQPAATAH
ncbi:MFS transporter [Sphingobium sp. CFD-2]|uniref:spinster family MFS transporter n=1 Tax=Sphingobium sp. CFD-2 TaxID=2878542 RepID=UPI00214D11F5|nr:MFS transporter [Sphingobium sp. CFD-2]